MNTSYQYINRDPSVNPMNVFLYKTPDLNTQGLFTAWSLSSHTPLVSLIETTSGHGLIIRRFQVRILVGPQLFSITFQHKGAKMHRIIIITLILLLPLFGQDPTTYSGSLSFNYKLTHQQLLELLQFQLGALQQHLYPQLWFREVP